MSAILKNQRIMNIKNVQHTELSFFKMLFSFNSFIFINCVSPYFFMYWYFWKEKKISKYSLSLFSNLWHRLHSIVMNLIPIFTIADVYSKYLWKDLTKSNFKILTKSNNSISSSNNWTTMNKKSMSEKWSEMGAFTYNMYDQ